MDVIVHAFWLPKAEYTAKEYEDDFDFSYNRAVRGRREEEPCYSVVHRPMAAPRFAVADGAMRTSFSGVWAHQLVELFVDRGPRQPVTLRKWAEQEARAWFSRVNRPGLPYHTVNKIVEGAFSTLLGFCLLPGEAKGGHWTALAIGDSCLFQVRSDDLIVSLPVSIASDLRPDPVLLSTRVDKNAPLWERGQRLRHDGDWRSGDEFWLMTDALAYWFLHQIGLGNRPWVSLREVIQASHLDPDFFERWIGDLRQTSNLRDDDVTLLMIVPD